MKRNVLLSLIVVLALLVVLVYGAGAVLPTARAFAAAQFPIAAASSPVLSAPQLTTLGDLESAYQAIYNQVNPSVVLIQVVTGSNTNRPPRGGSPFGSPFGQGPNGRSPFGQGQGQQALGSGFIWDTQGNIVTNNHVIDGASQITVTFADGSTVPGKLVAADPDSDLAVIHVDVPAAQLHPVQMADSTQVKVGQIAIAIGNPYGEQNTMTTGIISAIGRSLPVTNGNAPQGSAQGGTYTIPDVIQTDAAINPGNSGGVLLNSQGQVIGVTQSIESQSGASAGIGFAIPSTIVQQVVPSLIQTGHYDHPYLGLSGTSMTPGLAQAMGLPSTQGGALVASVTANGPAAKAGLIGSTKNATVDGVQTQVGGDVITAYNGQPVKTFDDLVALLARAGKPNQTVTLTILRNGKEQTITITLGTRPSGGQA